LEGCLEDVGEGFKGYSCLDCLDDGLVSFRVMFLEV